MSEDNKTALDTSEANNEQLRQSLRAYMADQNIGVPALCERINTALGLDAGSGDDAIALKSLQRFLAGQTLKPRIVQSIKVFVAALSEKRTG